MGFWEAAREEAGKEYGRRHAERYAKWETFKRWALVAGIGAAVLFVSVRTWDIGTYLAYGTGAAFVFVAAVLFAVLCVRTRAARTRRTYMRRELFRTYDNDDVYMTRPVRTERRTYAGEIGPSSRTYEGER